ncbi:OmpA family protein [Stigmatella erecta]|uniref:Outer membrane protein OmpA n=1 Tax=Stigmatella erecta TaxID=83460 RepID=A0A1I0LBT1_9BACT|nr:OmpA family protein [Stigmatella erecta]SEU37582.1 Outer membrane protein OmpA [Stigmatella erecta]
MTRSLPTVLALALGLAAASASAQDARFDAQLFRPSGAPQDIVAVSQSRPLSNLSVSGGVYLSFSINPLVLVTRGGDSSKKALSLVGNRFQLDAMANVGLLDWAEVGVDMPLILFQGGDNLEAIGTEGTVEGYVLGDLRLTSKIALPGLKRRAEDSGWGAALTFNLGLPTGNQDAFASDGAVTYTPGLIVDYRFGMGLLLTANAGFWARPDRIFNGVKIGDMAPFGLGAEMPLLRTAGVTAVGALHGAVALTKLPGQARQIPAEMLLGLRWYSGLGITVTVGGGLGCGCSLQSPQLSFFTSVIWVPAVMSEYAAIERFKEPPRDSDGDGIHDDTDSCPDEAGPESRRGCPLRDSDGDGVTDDLDACPTEVGTAARSGCPIRDNDGDGVANEDDRCPDVPAGPGGKNGCPLARLQGNKILILEPINFATDQDILLSESLPILEEVSQMLKTHPEIQRLLVEGHTDSRASDEYNLELSRRRAASIRVYLEESGVEPERLCSQGFGRSRPVAENKNEEGMALNRRVEFTVLPPPAAGEPRCPEEPADKALKKKGAKPAPAPAKPAPKP